MSESNVFSYLNLSAKHSLASKSIISPAMVEAGENVFKMKVPRRLNAILRLVFADIVFHKRAILLIC